VLALSGGGYRGLFTAQVLERIEHDTGKSARELFDLIAGTSIGGIIALGLGAGIKAQVIREEIQDRGRSIFDTKFFQRGRRPLFRNPLAPYTATKFRSTGLEGAIDAVFGDKWKDQLLSTLPNPTLVMAVSHSRARPLALRSYATSDLDLTLREAALVTSAAPGFFPPRKLRGSLYVDGGLIANAPDLQALAESIQHFHVDLLHTHMLSIGTASPGAAAPAGQAQVAGLLGWILRRSLVNVTMEAQEAMAVDNARAILGNHHLRIDGSPTAEQAKVLGLDAATPEATQVLTDLALEAWNEAKKNHTLQLTAFLQHRSSFVP
jgi:uncharacterized protein